MTAYYRMELQYLLFYILTIIIIIIHMINSNNDLMRTVVTRSENENICF